MTAESYQICNDPQHKRVLIICTACETFRLFHCTYKCNISGTCNSCIDTTKLGVTRIVWNSAETQLVSELVFVDQKILLKYMFKSPLQMAQ